MPESKSKTITIEVLKFALYVGAMIVSITVFILSSQAKQDQKIGENATSIERNATRHEEHTRHATEAFRKIDTTMTAQQQLQTDTREALIRVEESNKTLTEQVKELSKKVGP
jgi:hypothetical protein